MDNLCGTPLQGLQELKIVYSGGRPTATAAYLPRGQLTGEDMMILNTLSQARMRSDPDSPFHAVYVRGQGQNSGQFMLALAEPVILGKPTSPKILEPVTFPMK